MWEPEPRGYAAPPELLCAGRRVAEPRRHVVALELSRARVTGTRGTPRAAPSWEAGARAAGHVAAPELPRAGLLLVVSGDFFLVVTY
jgi:hypothetical protein